ncbi:MAG TPA: DNA translocase FtsK 4TM domain-containing protein [Anaerolineales bacterium]|nr:DNA translocase FtsK 4TM domain-containing protein [Anaerolineales bacterium]
MPAKKPAKPKPRVPARAKKPAKAQSARRGGASGKPAAKGQGKGTAVRTGSGSKARGGKGSTGAARKAPSAPPSLVAPLSLDRKLDILGVGMALAGLLLLLSLISANRNTLFEAVFNLLARGMGLGGYLLPIVLVGLGLWLILRNFDRVPSFDPERVTGVTLLFFNFITSLHFFAFPADRAAAFALAQAGRGGGYVGAFISEGLVGFLGLWGAVIALFAWLLVGMAFTLDVTVADLFRWVPPLAVAARARIAPLIRSRLARPPASIESPAGLPLAPPDAGGETLTAAAAEGGLRFDAPDMQPEWVLPALDQVFDQGQDIVHSDEYDRMNARVIEDTLASFGAPAKVVEIRHGPAITMFGVEPDFIESRAGKTRVRVSKIANLADDLALALAASTIRIQAPVPGEGYIGIEVPNESISLVALRDVIESENFKRMPPPLRFGLGQDVSGTPVAANLAAMPHLLIAGATGSGKSVCVNAVICCLLAHNSPDDLRMIMVDPKRVELTNYNGIPHLLAPVVVEMERVVGALQWVTREMDARYQKFHDSRTRNIIEYNRMIAAQGGKKLPYMVVIIDELADLMLLAPDQSEKAITRLAQLARATGIHLILATQRPSVDVVTGLIKANFPARIAFAVSSGVDSRVILDQPGADRLLGRGDMLFQAPDAPAPVRLQGVFVSDLEINQLVQFWRMQTLRHADASTLHSSRAADIPAAGIPLKQKPIWEEGQEEADKDPVYDEAVDLIRRQGRASVSMLQRRMRIGYTRAARLIETMEDKGIIGPPEGGAQTREVLDYGPAAPPAGEN